MDEDSEEFQKWMEEHKDICQKNHNGFSPAMEVVAALDIWNRSEERLYLRFTEVISDGLLELSKRVSLMVKM